MKVKNEIVTSFDRHGKHYILIEVDPYAEVKIMEDRWFDIDKISSSLTRIPTIDDFKFDINVNAKKEIVYFNIIFKHLRDCLKFELNSRTSYRDVTIFIAEKDDLDYSIYLKDMFISARNGIIDYSLQLYVKCGDIDLKIGDTVDTLKY
ncbi:hypothetical protein [Lacrimispora sp.]|uniref:hypothetical protein n=1 Tax=Lacrimispora sp. TaxID=2719234 RepID=UPI0028A66262|nr:hypothetical protein [Lacrimispora sp.]